MSSNLVVPVYIDTNALLDLLASIEGGFSVVEKVTTQSSSATGSQKSVSGEGGTEFGVPNVLSLLKIRLGGALSASKKQESVEQTESERYHTYGSLLYRLNSYLEAEGLVRRPHKGVDVWAQIEPSDFVEIRGVFRPNPLADSLGVLDRVMGLLELASGFDTSPADATTTDQKQAAQDQKKAAQDQKKAAQEQKRQMQQIRQFVQGLLDDIQKSNTRVFVVGSSVPEEPSTVILLFTDYLRDPTMAEVAHKEYRLLGKVVRKIESSSDEGIDLLRGTGLGGVGEEMLDKILSGFNQMESMNLPQVSSNVPGPALEVVPIAIYV